MRFRGEEFDNNILLLNDSYSFFLKEEWQIYTVLYYLLFLSLLFLEL